MYYWILLLFIAYILNVYFTFKQMEKYKKTLLKLKREYAGCYISTGKSRKFLKAGSVSILAIDKKGYIQYGEEMKGKTVFTNFKPIENIKGIFINDIPNKDENESIIQAISFYKEQVKMN